jgi:hypothetical protein
LRAADRTLGRISRAWSYLVLGMMRISPLRHRRSTLTVAVFYAILSFCVLALGMAILVSTLHCSHCPVLWTSGLSTHHRVYY